MHLHPKHAKTCTIKFYIIITTVMKRICISVSMFSCVAEKTCIWHELTSPDNDIY